MEIGPGRPQTGGQTMHYYPIQAQTHNGFSLIEVMIAMLVMTLGAGALALLLMASVRGTVQAQERSVVTLQAAELAQLIHANPAALGHFILPPGEVQDCQQGRGCANDEWAASHLRHWQQNLHAAMEQAHGAVCLDSSPLDGDGTDLSCDGSGQPVVKIVWQEQLTNQEDQTIQRLVLPLPQP